MSSEKTLIYDGECGLCRQFIAFVEKWDREGILSSRPYQDKSLYTEFPQLNEEECSKAIHLVEKDGRVHRGPDILGPLVEVFPKVKNIAWMLNLPGFKTASQVAYDLIAKYRKDISRICPGCTKGKKD